MDGRGVNLAIIGTGSLGSALGARLAGLGHGVTFASSSGDSARRVSKGVPGSRATDVASAVADADVVVLAVPFAALDQTLARAGDLRGRIVPPPRRWKMAVITLGALYPIVLALSTALRRLAGGWPLPVALLLSLGLTISLMTWVVVPALTTQLGPWLRR